MEKFQILKAMVNEAEKDVLTPVVVNKTGDVLKPGTSIINCKVSVNCLERTVGLFEPEVQAMLPEGIVLQQELVSLRQGLNRKISVSVCNTTAHEIIFNGRISIGNVVPIDSITPVEVKEVNHSKDLEREKTMGVTEKPKEEEECLDEQSELSKEDDECYRKALNLIDLSTLSKEQQKLAKQVLWQERRAFAVNDEIGCTNLEMSVKTVDEVPVQKSYNSIPRPLLKEVKAHIEDMLNRGWITHSKSAWSSPVVIVRKKGGEIRLCCDFRKLNAKTIKDKHPLPRVQASLDVLQGSRFFTVLDQSRAYYQGSIAEEDRHKTSFVTPWVYISGIESHLV